MMPYLQSEGVDLLLGTSSLRFPIEWDGKAIWLSAMRVGRPSPSGTVLPSYPRRWEGAPLGWGHPPANSHSSGRKAGRNLLIHEPG